jgi:hypothetical protein
MTIYKKKKNKTSQLRKWFKNYSPFLNLAQSILLSIIAILVTIVVTCEANNISQKQTEINYNENQPDFKIEIRPEGTTPLKLDDWGTFSVVENIKATVRKRSGIARNVKVKVYSIIEVTIFRGVREEVHIFYFWDDLKQLDKAINYDDNIITSRTNAFEKLYEKVLIAPELVDTIYLESRIATRYFNLINDLKISEPDTLRLEKFERKIYFQIDYHDFMNEEKSNFFLYTFSEHPERKYRKLNESLEAEQQFENERYMKSLIDEYIKVSKIYYDEDNGMLNERRPMSHYLLECNYDVKNNKCEGHSIHSLTDYRGDYPTF